MNEARIIGEQEFRILKTKDKEVLQIRQVVSCQGCYHGMVPDYQTTFSEWRDIPVVIED